MSSEDQTYWEPNEQFYENEEKSKEVKKVPVFNNLDSKKCCVCKNTVYKAEELSCLDALWHKDCFSCGFGATEIEQGEGCGKKLELGLYQSHNKVPYCNICGDRVSKELLLKRTIESQHTIPTSTNTTTANNGEEEDEEEIPPKSPAGPAARNSVVSPNSDFTAKSNDMQFFQYDMNAFHDEKSKTAQAAAEKYGVKLGTDKVCPTCSKTVYKAEELIALGNTWHKLCFTCGGSSETGCKRKLALGAYQVNNGIAYCQPCNDKMARENQSVYARPPTEDHTTTNTNTTGGNIDTADDVDTDNIPAPSPRKANTYNEFQSFELSSDFGKPQKENAAANKFRNAKDDATKCPQCKKTVYKAEELLAIGNVWHKACFTCGGSTDQGCGRKLSAGAHQTLNKTPFCSTCGDRLAKEAHKNIAKTVTSFPPSRAANTTPVDESPAYTPSASTDNFQSFELSSDFGKPKTGSAAANKFRGGRDDARKCPQCLTTVYKAEELLAIGNVWHPPCFTCGGVGDLGCKRKLSAGAYQTLNKHPYCNACCDRLAKEGQMMAGAGATGGVPSASAYPPRTGSNQDLIASMIEERGGDTFDPTAVGNVTAEYGYNNNSNAVDEPDGTGGKVRRGSLSIADRSAAFKKPAWTAENEELKNKPTGTGKAFKPVEDTSNKCPVCSKTVYKTEQVLALKETWHKDCFTCGGKGDLGCKRKLGLEEYRGDSGLPYCGNCYDRIHKEKYSKSVAASAGTLVAGGAVGVGFNGAPVAGGRAASPATRMQETDPNFQSFELSDDATRTKSPTAADKFRNLAGTGGAKKCPICTETVYQAEELIAMKMSWHKTCFTCGGDQGKGCKRRLGMGDFQGKNNIPYCSTCFDKVVKEEIANRSVAGTGTTTTTDTATGNTSGNLVTGEEQSLQELSLESLEIALIDSDRRGEAEVAEIDTNYPSTPHSNLSSTVEVEGNHNASLTGSGIKTAAADQSYKFESIKFEVDSTKAMLDAENEVSVEGSVEQQLEKAEYEQTEPETPTKAEQSQQQQKEHITPSKSLSSTTHSSPGHKNSLPARSPVTIKNEIDSESFETHFEGEDYQGYKLHYSSDFDENGAIYWIGTTGKTTAYQNPHNNGVIVAKMSSVFKGAEENLVSREPNNTPTYTGNDPYSYIEIDLGNKYTMLLDKYSLRHGGSSKGNLLRNWILQGKASKSENNDDWVTLREHTEDFSFPAESRATASWDIEYSPQNMSTEAAMIGFRYFRITQTGFNANGNDCLFCAGIEFYGVLFEKL